MINLASTPFDDESFVKNYIDLISKKMSLPARKRLTIKQKLLTLPNNVSLDDDFIEVILTNPFDNNNLKGLKGESFISGYLLLKDFLIKGKAYFDYVKRHSLVNIKNHEMKGIYRDLRDNSITPLIGLVNANLIDNAKKSNEKYWAFYDLILKELKLINVNFKEVFDYSFIDKETRYNIIQKINVPICPYCNRQYIETYKKDKQGEAIAQLDHFYNKSVFSLFSLTLANFIPSCAYCNTILKRDFLFPYKYPYVDKNNDDVIFLINTESVKTVYHPSDISISLNKANDYYHQLSFFNAAEIYENHKQDVANLLTKSNLYNQNYKKSLEGILKETITDSQLRVMLFNTTIEDGVISATPLAKLTKDILFSKDIF